MSEDQINNNIIDKIRKLFALAESPNEHEAALALIKAHEFMSKFKVNMTDVSLNQYTTKTFNAKRMKKPDEYSYIVLILQGYFNVQFVSANVYIVGFIYFVCGKPEHVEIAKYLYVFLERQYRELWKIHKNDISKRVRKLKRLKDSYYEGITFRLVKELADNGIKLSPSKEREDYVKKQFPNTAKSRKRKYRRDFTHMNAGYKDGESIKIKTAITSDTTQPKQLPPKDREYEINI